MKINNPHRFLTLVVLALAGTSGRAAVAAIPAQDSFDYTMAEPAPSPWSTATSGDSENYIAASSDPIHHNELVVSYSGSGWITMSRSDIAGSNALYEIEFWDDGTRDYGLLFMVYDAFGHFISIGVNNRVANGSYYVRTDASAGNTGYNIPAARNGASARNNWHQFQLYVTPSGSFPMVDGVPAFDWGMSYNYAALTSVSSVELMANWSKPANYYWLDNFRVTSLANSNTPPGTLINPTTGRISNPWVGSSSLDGLSANDLLTLTTSSSAAYWGYANTKRRDIIAYALNQDGRNGDGTLSDEGVICDDAARIIYQSSDTEWCSEFARDMFWWPANGIPDRRYCATNTFLGCIHYIYVHDISEVDEFKNMFQTYGGWVDHWGITPATAEPGDYLTVPGSSGDHYGHSAVIVGVSEDASEIYTIEGNFLLWSGRHCEGFNRRPYFVNGVLDPNIDAIGKINKLF